MRVNRNQLINGITSYAREEIIAKVPDQALKTVLGAAVFALRREPAMLDNLLANPAVSALMAADGGEYDIESISCALMESIKEYGNIVVTVPKIPFIMDEKTLSFSSGDIGRLKEYIERG